MADGVNSNPGEAPHKSTRSLKPDTGALGADACRDCGEHREPRFFSARLRVGPFSRRDRWRRRTRARNHGLFFRARLHRSLPARLRGISMRRSPGARRVWARSRPRRARAPPRGAVAPASPVRNRALRAHLPLRRRAAARLSALALLLELLGLWVALGARIQLGFFSWEEKDGHPRIGCWCARAFTDSCGIRSTPGCSSPSSHGRSRTARR